MRRFAGLFFCFFAGCGGDDGQAASNAGAGGSGGLSGGSATAGTSGDSGRAGAMPSAGRSGSAGGASAGAAAVAGEGGEAGATEPLGGAGGEPEPVAGSGGHGEPAGSGGEAGEPVAPEGGAGGSLEPQCDCAASEDCIGGECVIKPECDCAALGVECSPLSSALGDAFACPVAIHCGTCAEGELCMGYSDGRDLAARFCAGRETSCLTVEEWHEEGFNGTIPECPVSGWPSACSAPYALCSSLVFLADTGDECPRQIFSGPSYWSCGPAI